MDDVAVYTLRCNNFVNAFQIAVRPTHFVLKIWFALFSILFGLSYIILQALVY